MYLKKILIIIGIISLSFNNLNAIDWGNMFNKDMDNLSKKTIEKLEYDKQIQKDNNLMKKNTLNRIIEEKNMPEYTFKKPKTIYVFQRKDFRKVDGNFIIFEGGGWKQVIATQKQEWEY